MKNLYLILISMVTANLAMAEPVPTEFLDRNLRPPLLDLSKGTTHDLIEESTVGSSTYYLIEQRPPIGDWSYVLVEKRKNTAAKFIVAGAIIDVLRQSIPQPARKSIARAYVTHEMGPVVRGIKPVTPEMQANYNEVKPYLPDILKKQYKQRGFQ